MGVLLQGFYKLRPNRAVPSPADGDPKTPWWWNHLAAQANDFRTAGFTAVWLPPVLKTSAGVHIGSDGYGPFDDYDIGSKSQMGSVPTRFGSREQLQRCVATFRANGLDVYLDMVEHHRSGDPGNFVFRYRGADGTPATGRFPKDPLNFVPNVPRDPNLGGPAKDDFPFGRELAPINGKPQGYVFNGLIDAADWLTRALDVQGYRLDDVKGLSTDFLFPFLTQKAMAGKFAFGEFFDGNRTLVNAWIFNPHGMRGRVSAFDFPLRFILAAMCSNPGRFNMADLDHAGLAGMSPVNAVTFVENHDTDLNEPVVTNKILAYAYILTSEGYPCVYYRDYSTDPNCYGLKQPIDNLIWIHEKLAAGPTQQRWQDFDLFAYERVGQPGLLVALNNNPSGPRTIEVATAFGANVTLHDYTGHGPDLVTSAQGTVRITVPRNVSGGGYVCYSRAGIGGGFAVTTRTVTQEFESAADLDLPPAEAGKTAQPGRIWCAAETPIQAVLEMPGITATTEATVEIAGPEGGLLASRTFTGPTGAHAALEAKAASAGFHALRIKLGNVPDDASRPYKLAVTYTGAERLPAQADAAIPATPQPAADPKEVGEWKPKFSLPNVAIHTHLLPDGKVLFWGRRDQPHLTLDEHFCTPQIWDPATGETKATPQPLAADGRTKVNLFCSGHTFLPDGRLLVVGGHWLDGEGIDQASVYDYRANSWTALPAMNKGRWYPTAVTLHDGTALVMSGSFAGPNGTQPINEIQQVWDGERWHELVNFHGMPLFPRVHAAPNGQVFMSGPLTQTYLLDTNGPGNWTPLPPPGGLRDNSQRDYAPSVLYDVGKVTFIGGGNDQPTRIPTTAAEIIDVAAANPAWRPTGNMHHPRRQHNATILPDGTVLVTGGTKGGGGSLKNPGFNDLSPGEPIHPAELWDPATGQWTELAAEAVDRCYHSTAILLPDATVLSAGGGEYRPDGGGGGENAPQDSHRDAQIYHPPYLFRGARPDLTAAPDEVGYGQSFPVGTSHPEEIALVSWIRLSSVTHSFNMDQRINFLAFSVARGGLTITAPATADVCPPGYYMLFLLNKEKVPSISKILRIAAPAVPRRAATARASTPRTQPIPVEAQMSTAELDRAITGRAIGTSAAIGLTSRCPYGLGACWGGAYEALQQLDGVAAVRPIANAADSMAEVFLHGDTLPDVNRWAQQIAQVANGSYDFRGVEVIVKANVNAQNGRFGLTGPSIDKQVLLAPLEQVEKVQFDRATGTAKPALPEEHSAYERLVARYRDAGAADLPVHVTGPLRQTSTGWTLHVRDFDA
jgi:glycosidase